MKVEPQLQRILETMIIKIDLENPSDWVENLELRKQPGEMSRGENSCVCPLGLGLNVAGRTFILKAAALV